MKSKMVRYTMLNSMRQTGEREDTRKNYGETRNAGYGEIRNDSRRSYDDMENRFRDQRGREHYDTGRYAPMKNEGDDDMGMRRGRDGGMRNEMRGNYENEERRMNQIGFDREMPDYFPLRVEPYNASEIGNRWSQKTSGGASGDDGEFTEETARMWTQKMHNEDGTKGEHWNMEQVKKLMTQRGVQYNTAEVYAIMNSLYSDYCKVFKKYGFNSPEAYLDLAIAWLNDTDAVDNKAMMYYECIVKH